MKYKPIAIVFVCTALALAPLILTKTATGSESAEHSLPSPAAAAKKTKTTIPKFFVPPPPFSEDIFPCSECHADMDPDPTRRELEEHVEIAESFSHAADQRWCLDCHNLNDRDKLRLVSGELIPFEESYSLCGQCHGTIFRDWKAGLHGKRTGEWNGKKLYRLCVHCHNPHHPKFAPLKPLPPPKPPHEIRNSPGLADDQIPRNPIGDLE